jgi:uncharacterized integral membrane protein
MTTTPASTTSSVSSALGARLRSLARRADHIGAARLLHVTAVTVAIAVAVLAMVDAAISLYTFAVQHQSGPMGAIMLTAAVLGVYTVITAYAWRTRLHGGQLPRLSWLLWWIAVGVGLAATAAAAASDGWVARGINAAPIAALAAVTGLALRPRQP